MKGHSYTKIQKARHKLLEGNSLRIIIISPPGEPCRSAERSRGVLMRQKLSGALKYSRKIICDLFQGTVLVDGLSKDLIMAVNFKGPQTSGNQTKSSLGHLLLGMTWRKSEKTEV